MIAVFWILMALSLAAGLGMVGAARAGELKVALAAELGCLVTLSGAVWVLYHGTWTPPWLQLAVAVVYAGLAAVWISGTIGRAKEAFTGPLSRALIDPWDVPDEDEDEDGDAMTPGMPDPCQPIGCDNGIHRPGCPYAEVDAS